MCICKYCLTLYIPLSTYSYYRLVLMNFHRCHVPWLHDSETSFYYCMWLCISIMAMAWTYCYSCRWLSSCTSWKQLMLQQAKWTRLKNTSRLFQWTIMSSGSWDSSTMIVQWRIYEVLCSRKDEQILSCGLHFRIVWLGYVEILRVKVICVYL